MPFYRFAIQGQDPPPHEAPRWLSDDVEALKEVGLIAADLARGRSDDPRFIIALRAGPPKD